MPWTTASLELVTAMIDSARIDGAVSGDAISDAPNYFNLFHPSIAANIRARIRQGGHPLDLDPMKVPPEFQILVALKIAALILSRPGLAGTGDSAVFTLSREQRDIVTQCEELLDRVSKGEAVTATDNPEVVESATTNTAQGAKLLRQGIRNDSNWSGLGTT